METRPYFILGDLVTGVGCALAATAVTTWAIGGGVGMLPGMVAGMALGMLVALPLIFGLVPLFGSMELLAPSMLAAMLGGMWGGMWPLEGTGISAWGIGSGIAAVAVVYGLDALYSGPARVRP